MTISSLDLGISELRDKAYAKITTALGKYDRSQLAPRLRLAEQQRADIQERFPIEQWPQLPMARYALGLKDKETYCRWIEFRSPELGSISGGSSMKMVIFKRKDRPGWFFPEQFESPEHAWEALRQDFVQALALGAKGEWSVTDQLPTLYPAPSLRVKTLHVYFPQQILPIYSRAALLHFLQVFGAQEAAFKGDLRAVLNRELLRRIAEIKGFDGWSTNEIAFFLFDAFNPREAKRIYKIAPGEDAKYWAECRDGGYICVGWDKVGDLTDFESQADFKARFAEDYDALYKGNKSKISAKSNELWTLRSFEPGDIIVANQGTSRILAVGEVQDPGYEWRSDRDSFRHTVRVKWNTDVARAIDPQPSWATVTVKKVPAELYDSILKTTAGEGKKLPSPVDPELDDFAATLERKGQVILYGPPGTGKTYTARRLAVHFLTRGNPDWAGVLSDEKKFARAESELATTAMRRRTWWVVANPQEWQWDQLFKQGKESYRQGRLKRNYALLQPGDLVVGYQSKPDKRVVALARVSKSLHSTSGGEARFEIVPIAQVPNGLSYEELLGDSVMASSEPMRFRNQGTLFALSELETERLFALLLERNPALQGYLGDSEEGGIGALTRLTFHPSYAYEDFIEGFRPVDNGTGTLALRLEDGIFKRVCSEARANPDRTYVVLIDEINRANLGKVFGEVVTLLEKDKRGLTITLPQSKDSFSVPKNVSIIGTMNTADRSIRLLDAALRRRFAFAELMPDTALLRGAMIGELALDEFLEQLNLRIAKSIGREKQIGHSFLLDEGQAVSDPEEFARRFRQEILPLLQEYCYEDYSALAGYVGNTIVDRDTASLDHEVLSDTDSLIEALVASFKDAKAEG